MKNIYYFFSLFFLAAAINSLNAQTVHKVDMELMVNVSNLGTAEIYSDTLNEGQTYTIKQQTLPSAYAVAQPLYNALVGSEFYFEQGSLKEDIKLMFILWNVNLNSGLYGIDSSGIHLFFNAYFQVYVNNIPVSGTYTFQNGKHAVFKIKKTPEFYSFRNSAGIDPADLLKFAYQTTTGGYDTTGIITVEDSSYITAMMSHFSLVAGREEKSVTGIKESVHAQNIPSEFALRQNYPNPFNPSTTIEYDLPAKSFVELNVYNILGVKVASLVNNTMSAGTHTVTFKPANLSSGLYIYEMKANNITQSRKMLYMK